MAITKIAVAEGGHTTLDLGLLQRGLQAALTEAQAIDAVEADLKRIVAAADDTLIQAGVLREQVSALYFTGGSTGLKPLAQRMALHELAIAVAIGLAPIQSAVAFSARSKPSLSLWAID